MMQFKKKKTRIKINEISIKACGFFQSQIFGIYTPVWDVITHILNKS